MAAEAGIQQEIQALYRGHHDWLHGWLRRRLGCAHRAADLAHDTFMRLLAREEALQVLEPRAFLSTVAQRVLANHWRREKLEQAYLEALACLPEPVVPSAEARAILLETLHEIDALLDGLPVPVKRAFLMAQLDGMSQLEIAAALDISVTTVKRYLVRAGTQCYFAQAGA
ncbi:RNA polymerase subunit sigma [Cupriavidus sp. USMAA2-4]|uniref:RNA polymerase subunit sigma n=1 Tax=Cupriavidus malaysiensis TaxID=367825 RepID=A0ABN4TWL0_9BURK|nr:MULTISPECIES: sigma-70 family RNA polymerase sigma factor [Cupriavidus]AOY96215.1 RNA polymerase subunit sigma [Cupriavidus sp. USMAA2-4]AOZ09256.1 RNA polymerase subunit sigma [Cupriavidus malaysiensis]